MRYFNLVLFLLIVISLNSLNKDELLNNNNFLVGYGKASSLEKADKKAINDLISQISISVESNFKNITTEDNGELKEFSELMISTYSNTTLNNAERLVDSEEDFTIVYRFIKKDELSSLFEKEKLN